MVNTLKINKKFLLKIVFIVFILSLLPLNSLFAQEYKPISVIPVDYSIGSGDISVYLNDIFTLVLGIAAVLAVIQIALGGIEYMTSSKIGSIENAKSKMWGAVIGILLLLSTYIILQKINPQLLNFTIGPADPETETPSSGGGGRDGGGDAE